MKKGFVMIAEMVMMMKINSHKYIHKWKELNSTTKVKP
jgi:hypothetical protein